MTQLPHALFQKAAQQAGQTLPDAGDYGAAMIFFPQDPLKRMRSRKLLEMILSREGLELLFWRDVPVCPEILSEKARSSMPYIAQCFIRRRCAGPRRNPRRRPPCPRRPPPSRTA